MSYLRACGWLVHEICVTHLSTEAVDDELSTLVVCSDDACF